MTIMGTLLLLAAEAGELAEGAEGGGFGLNFNPLETNLVNLAIVIGVLVYFGRGFLGKTLNDRRDKIEAAIRDAEKRKQDAAAALAEQQQKLAQAQAEAARIRSEAEASAKRAADAVLAASEQEIERMRASAAQDLATQQEKIINELRQRVVTLAMQRAEDELRTSLSHDTQARLVDRSIAMLGGQS